MLRIPQNCNSVLCTTGQEHFYGEVPEVITDLSAAYIPCCLYVRLISHIGNTKNKHTRSFIIYSSIVLRLWQVVMITKVKTSEHESSRENEKSKRIERVPLGSAEQYWLINYYAHYHAT